MKPGHLIALLVTVTVWPLASGQPTDDEIDEWVLSAEGAFERGRDRKGLGYLERVLKARSADVDALRLALLPAVNLGRYADADAWSKRLLDSNPDDRRARIDRAEILVARGRLVEAEEVLSPLLGANPEPGPDGTTVDFEARALLAGMRLMRGKRKEADELYDSIVQDAKRVLVKDPRDLVALSEAYVFYRGMREAEKVLVEAQGRAGKKEPVDPRPSLALGRLYLDRFYAPGDAVQEFKAALEARPRLADAYVGLARSYTAWQKGQEATSARRKARGINPRHPDVLVAEASKRLGDMMLREAKESLDRLLDIDARSREGLTLRAALHLFEGRREDFEKGMKAVFAVDPGYGRAHLLVAGVLNERRRWPEALEQCRRATKVSPEDPEVWDALARYSFFLGLDEEGHQALRRADKSDVFSHPWRKNMFESRRVLGSFYKEFSSRHFVHRVHQKEVNPFKPYLVPFCEKSWRALTKKYTFDPPGLASAPGKVLVEWFRSHQGFSVRTLGFTHLGATGVCFGPFICMNSPGARKPGEFSWARTFHHELAHTMTVGLSKGRTPRWLTEGLSTWEEKCWNGAWDRGLYRDLVDAIHSDDLCKVQSFDANFSGPRVIFAYFQGGLVCRWMVERWGMPKIVAMLKAYGEDKTTAEVLSDVLEINPREFDRAFAVWVKDHMKDVKIQPRLTAKRVSELQEELRKNPKSGEALIGLAGAYLARGDTLDAQEMVYRARKASVTDPRLSWIEGRIAIAKKSHAKGKDHYGKAMKAGFDDHHMRLDLAKMAEAAGDTAEAREHYEQAVAVFPMVAGPQDPRLALARIAEGDRDLEAAVRWLEEHLSTTYEDLDARRKLVSFYRLRDDREAVRRHLEAMILVYPLEDQVHVGLGDLHLEEKNGDEAITEFEVALALLQNVPQQDRSPAKEADVRVKLGRAHLLDPEGAEEAEAQARQSLELVPGHAGARALLDEARGRKDR